MERKLANTARLSLFVTAGVIVAVLVAAVILGLAGSQVLAGVLGTGGVVSIAWVLIKGGGNWSGDT